MHQWLEQIPGRPENRNNFEIKDCPLLSARLSNDFTVIRHNGTTIGRNDMNVEGSCFWNSSFSASIVFAGGYPFPRVIILDQKYAAIAPGIAKIIPANNKIANIDLY